ncbi:UNVERIFIED_CONTAM: hypothetical protein Sradi_7275200 [Sesamum radiatum]|uniref:Reverse transcriptase zinc-binding domain-containing protein n=1 Tax=Sesamum radiatum TaxID=300843 RepID=A0AAW2IIS3_SESRA
MCRVFALGFCRIWSWFDDYSGPGGRIWIAWNDLEIGVEIIRVEDQFIHCALLNKRTSAKCLISVVYGDCEAVRRRRLWEGLLTIAEDVSENPWCVLGDFNAVIDSSESCGRSAESTMAMAEFRGFISDAALVHLPFSGCPYTWHNCSEGSRSLWRRLDRVLVNETWLVKWPSSSYFSAIPSTSDHSPLVLVGAEQRPVSGCFRFDNFLTKQAGFLDAVRGVWRHHIYGTKMYGVVCKLKALKTTFRACKKKTGELSTLVCRAKEFLDIAQCLFELYKEDILLELVQWCRVVYCKAAEMETSPVTQAEIRTAFFDISEDSAPGPDGYTSGFFKAAWPEIVRVSEFRPIACCNVVYKAIAKILVGRMQQVTLNQRSIKNILAEFEDMSGLKVNPNKSSIILSKAVRSERQEILEVLGFQEGRVQVIKSVLSALHMYWGSVFILPKAVIKVLERRMTDFLWKGPSGAGYTKVAWVQCCKPKEEGGLGIRSVQYINQALILKQIWRILQQEPRSIWVAWVLRYRLRNQTVWTFSSASAPWFWRKMLKLCPRLKEGLEYRVGDGRKFRLWSDIWHPRGPLLFTFPRGPCITGLPADSMLHQVIHQDQWHWPAAADFDIQEIVAGLPSIYSQQPDEIKWKSNSGMCTTSAILSLLQPSSPHVEWHHLLRGKFKIPRHGFILWLAFLERLSTMDRIWVPHSHTDCVLCGVWQTDISWASGRWRNNHLLNEASRAMLAAMVYYIWRERNSRRFANTSSSAEAVTSRAIEEVRNRILSVHIRPSLQLSILYRVWGITRVNGCLNPRHVFVLWLAIRERLSMLDRPWVSRQDVGCVLCNGEYGETHDHLFFKCSFSARCIFLLKRCVRFQWLGLGWQQDILWASRKWRGRHFIHEASRAMLAALVYSIWRERNNRLFLDTANSADAVAMMAIEDIRCCIVSVELKPSIQLFALYRNWKIPWEC